MSEGRRHFSIAEKITVFFFVSAAITSLLIISLLQIGLIQNPVFVSLAVIGIAAGVAGGVGWFLNRGLRADLGGLMEAARQVSQGELDRVIAMREKKYTDEVDDLRAIFQEMQKNLQRLVGQIQLTGQSIGGSAYNLSTLTEEMSASTHQIALTMGEISRGAESQNKLIVTTSSGMREMVHSAEQTESSARESANRATQAVETAQSSSRLAYQAVEKMRAIFERVEDSSRLMIAFSDKIKQVSKIVGVIGGIAQRTTLLSLNATIEAAKAGEYGRGFAVVADEIRKLAESTTRSAEQVAELIGGVEQESRRVLEVMQVSVDTVEKSRSDVTNIGGSLDGIVKSFKEVQIQTQGISDLSRAQAEQSSQVLRAIEEIQKVAEKTASLTMQISASTNEQTASMNEMTTAAQELSQLAEELRAATSRFRLGDAAKASEGQTPQAVA
ncbi:MAG: methyl-accepting chemotaxis protein [Bdellovibrionota bacterium]